MAVTVRLFAALRDAAGTAQVYVAPAALPDIVAELCERFGEPFATRVSVASGMLDGQRVALDDDIAVDAGSELALLPPFSGGSTVTDRQLRIHRLLLTGSILVPALLVLGGGASRWTYGVVVVVIAIGCAVDLHTALAVSSARTMLPATLVLGVGPALMLLAAPSAARQWLGGVVAGSVMLTFVLAFASPRRQETASVVGATLFAGLLVAVGTAALVVLYDETDLLGLTGVLVLIALTDAAVMVAGRPAAPQPARYRLLAAVAVALPGAVVVTALGGTGAMVVRIGGLATVAIGSALLRARLRQVLRRHGTDREAVPALLIGTADAVLIGAPLAVLWTQSVLQSSAFTSMPLPVSTL